MYVESSTLRSSEAEHGLVLGSQGSVPQGDQAEQPGSPSIEEIAAVEVPGETEPRLQKRTLLVDSLIRECKCDLSSDEFLKAVRYAGPLVTLRRPTPEESVFDAPPGYFAIHLKSLESGFRFPLESLVIDFFKYFDFLPCQLVPNSHRYLAGFLIRCREVGVRADLERLLTLFRVAKSSGSDGEEEPAVGVRGVDGGAARGMTYELGDAKLVEDKALVVENPALSAIVGDVVAWVGEAGDPPKLLNGELNRRALDKRVEHVVLTLEVGVEVPSPCRVDLLPSPGDE
ncbi:unnamed protein product [Cuscuta campestris]|uniref:Transposase (putative) gypsy type domain-containing protein n=1 Tax=Cuscuta campestris TaxID=132261 RepID=A0A484LS32_9ASTE|nr:unnamed protein product [Cuscuta campestris]